MVDVPVLGTGVFNVSVRVRPKAYLLSKNLWSLSLSRKFIFEKETMYFIPKISFREREGEFSTLH